MSRNQPKSKIPNEQLGNIRFEKDHIFVSNFISIGNRRKRGVFGWWIRCWFGVFFWGTFFNIL